MTNRPPGKGNKKAEDEAQSRVISARLHPSDEYERAALQVFDGKIADGFTPRQILTDALNFAAGHTPDMFRREGRIDGATEKLETLVRQLNPEDLDMRLSELLSAFEQRIETFLKSLRSTDPTGFKRFADSQEDDELDLDEEFIKNAKKAVRKSFRQRRGDDDE